MNKVILIGNLTRDAELKILDSGKTVGKFGLAVGRYKKGEADFFNCVAWGQVAEVVATYTQKGSKIAVEGRIETRSYEKEGNKVYYTEIIISNVELLDNKKQSDTPQKDNIETTNEDLDNIPF